MISLRLVVQRRGLGRIETRWPTAHYPLAGPHPPRETLCGVKPGDAFIVPAVVAPADYGQHGTAVQKTKTGSALKVPARLNSFCGAAPKA